MSRIVPHNNLTISRNPSIYIGRNIDIGINGSFGAIQSSGPAENAFNIKRNLIFGQKRIQ